MTCWVWPTLRRMLGLLVHLLQSAPSVTAQVTPSALSIDWTSVQTSTPLTNWNRGLLFVWRDSDYSIFTANLAFPSVDVGPCTCDLTVGLCDANCCCDSDCSSTDIALWFKTCQSRNTLTLPYCSNYLSKVNWYGSINGTATPAVGGGLCVVFTNSMSCRCHISTLHWHPLLITFIRRYTGRFLLRPRNFYLWCWIFYPLSAGVMMRSWLDHSKN